MDFKDYIKQSRIAAGLTQVEVAQRLGYRTSHFVSNWEAGLSFPPIGVIKPLARLYKINPDEIFEMILEIELARLELDKRVEYAESM